MLLDPQSVLKLFGDIGQFDVSYTLRQLLEYVYCLGQQ